MPASPTPEHWRQDAGDADIAVLDIPPASDRVRAFNVDVSFVVRSPAQQGPHWHQLAVELNGRRQWTRRIGTSNPGEQDGLDYHVRVHVAVGEALRVRALTQVQGAVRARLLIEAAEA